MAGVAFSMLRRRNPVGAGNARCDRKNASKVLSYGASSGLLSGFFGIGGGFLIVPGLITSARMAMIEAVGTSLVAVTAFGLTTAVNYAVSGLVDWALATTFIVGGIGGSLAGTTPAKHFLSTRILTIIFATIVLMIAAYTLWASRIEFYLSCLLPCEALKY